jgi:hypothetical protein
MGCRWLLKNREVQWLMRSGHAAKGLLYGFIGLFAINSLFYDDRTAQGSEGVLIALGQDPVGNILLFVLMLGLLGYVLWRFIQAVLNPGTAAEPSWRQKVQRIGYMLSGLTYLGIAYSGLKLVIGLAVDFDDTIEDLASVLFERAIGPWILLGVGAGVVGVGLTYVYGAFSGSYIGNFRSDLYTTVKHWTIAIGKIGITARGVSFILIGQYLVRSAYFIDDDLAGDLGSILDRLDDQPGGEIWLIAIALGFIAYAIYMLVLAYYLKFPGVKPKNQ